MDTLGVEDASTPVGCSQEIILVLGDVVALLSPFYCPSMPSYIGQKVMIHCMPLLYNKVYKPKLPNLSPIVGPIAPLQLGLIAPFCILM